jgi:hypothetical protein
MSEPKRALFPTVETPTRAPAWLDNDRAAQITPLFEPDPQPAPPPGLSTPPQQERPVAQPPPQQQQQQQQPQPRAAAPQPPPQPQAAAEPPPEDRPLSRLPPPPKLDSLIPGGRSAPPPANDTGYAMMREHAEAFANAAIELGIARAATLAVLEGQLLDLSIEIASALIEREIEREPELHATLARAALASLGDATQVTLRTSPDAFHHVCDALGGEHAEVRGVRVSIVSDATIPGLGCVVDGENMRVDATISERLRAVRRAFEEERRKTAESVE